MRQEQYTTSVTGTGGFRGHVRSENGGLDLDVAAPEALGGPGGGVDAEQLLGAAVVACFAQALQIAASARGADAARAEVTA